MSKKYDSLGDRMKGYENIARNYLTRRIPTIIRVDGKAFHTFTNGLCNNYNGCMVRIQHPKDVQRFRFNGYACFFKCLCCRAVEELS